MSLPEIIGMIALFAWVTVLTVAVVAGTTFLEDISKDMAQLRRLLEQQESKK